MMPMVRCPSMESYWGNGPQEGVIPHLSPGILRRPIIIEILKKLHLREFENMALPIFKDFWKMECFFKIIWKIPPPQGAAAPWGAAEGGAGGMFFKIVWKIHNISNMFENIPNHVFKLIPNRIFQNFNVLWGMQVTNYVYLSICIYIYMFDMLIDKSICLLIRYIYIYIFMTLSG